jgi:apolipoprotein D and lipocalin family protein
MHTRLIAIFICLCSINALAIDTATDGTKEALTTIAALDVPRYMGVWYEIAKYPNWFQRKCTGNTKAEYSLKSDGKVQVVNRCRMENGEMNEAIGSARQVGAPTSPRLEVRFAPAWLSFIPAAWGDYWIIDLDEGYQLAAVSEPSRQYLWVLSRTPRVNRASYESLVGRLAKKGYDVRNLELTKQDD